MRISTVFLGAVLALAPSVAAGETVVITESHCRELVRHVPLDDVAYRPGVDVKGRKVAPADLGGGTHIPVPEQVVISIDVDLSETIGAAPSGLYEPEARLGSVVYRDGRAWYNGVELATDATAAIAAECRRRMAGR
jgi:hypothetical protein